MLNAGSLLYKSDNLADLVRHTASDVIGVTETRLHDGIRDDEICLPGYTLFRQDRPSHKKRGGAILDVKSHLLPQHVMLPPIIPSLFYVRVIVC